MNNFWLRWRFVWSRQWMAALALVLLFAIVCHFLATWQLNRRAEAQIEIERIDANYDAAPLPLEEVLPSLDFWNDDLRWKPVSMTGQFVPDQEVVIRNRPFSGQAGYEVVSPFELSDGRVFFVNRGWVPGGEEANTTSEYVSVPDGQQDIVVRLKPAEPAIAGRTGAADMLASIDLVQLQGRISAPAFTGAYGLLVADNGADYPVPALRPVRDEGPHLSYALQWYVFAAIAFAGWGWAVRNERRRRDEDEDDVSEQSLPSASSPQESRYGAGKRAPASRIVRGDAHPKGRKSDSEIEDELIDTQG